MTGGRTDADRPLRRLPGGRWLLSWIDRWRLASLLLDEAIKGRASYLRRRLLDVGCGSQPYRALLPEIQQYGGPDLSPHDRAKVAGNGMSLPFRDQAFDAVLCTEVLGHVPEPSRLVGEVGRVLRPGGYLLDRVAGKRGDTLNDDVLARRPAPPLPLQ
ncbi:MAG TPA: class I SAM-dependent methyltransferase [Chloroflexota bacterium]|nr:class I SAM-dependent methyltransferase [Chloroflexota bacterium]